MNTTLAPETKRILKDIKSRISQFNAILQDDIENGCNKERLMGQIAAFDAVMTLLDQVENSGRIYRGNDYVPDPVEVEMRKRGLLAPSLFGVPYENR